MSEGSAKTNETTEKNEENYLHQSIAWHKPPKVMVWKLLRREPKKASAIPAMQQSGGWERRISMIVNLEVPLVSLR